MIDIISALTGFTVGTALTWALRRKVDRVLLLFRNRYDHPIDERMKMVIVARTDIEMKPGKLAAQCAHAAVSNYVAATKTIPNSANLWLARGQAKIVVKCNSEQSLNKIKYEAQNAKIIATVIKDAGRTQLDPGTVTVLGIGPAKTNIIDEVTGQLKLY